MEHQKEEEDLQMALRMSLQSSPSDSKRSMPPEDVEESPEAKGRRLRREIMAAAAEKRMATSSRSAKDKAAAGSTASAVVDDPEMDRGAKRVDGKQLSAEEADRLFLVLFGGAVSKSILAQWTNQGIRFSSDPETCMGLVQHKGGPCGVLAPVQAFILKYLLFFPKVLNEDYPSVLRPNFYQPSVPQISPFKGDDFSSITDIRRTRALVLGMVEILFSCGEKKRAVVATLGDKGGGQTVELQNEAMEAILIESGADLKKHLRIRTHNSPADAFHHLMLELPVFQSRLGAVLFLISALLSRGLDSIQTDRDDPTLPLVTSPFGHASQEIVNLLLCGEATANVFDGRMDLGGGMSLGGIAGEVEVGFLTLLESLNYCKVGQLLKRPRWPIWVLGSESHYTVLFALDGAAQAEAEAERREAAIRAAFDARDQSGGGGFVAADDFRLVLLDTGVDLPVDQLAALCATGYVVWSEFWKVLMELDGRHGGLKLEPGRVPRKRFELFHFNGIAKSGGADAVQRPRLCHLRVSVPPKWFQEDELISSDIKQEEEEPAMQAPLVDCIRTRWPRASCSWTGDPPSIV
ncbi:ubiquitin interaction motif-containing protein [Wolffia australiana]